MTADLIRLELRKQYLASVGFAAAFALTLPLGAWALARNGYSWGRGFDAVLLFWAMVGVPLAAVVLGAAAGSGVAASRAQEAWLPVSPRTRLGAAAAAAALQLLCVGALVALVAAALSPDWRAVLGVSDRFADEILLPYIEGSSAVSVYALLLAAGVAHQTGSGPAGGVVGGVAGALCAAFVGGGLLVSLISPGRAPFWPFAVVGTLAALGSALAMMRRGARLSERRRWTKTAFAAQVVLVVCGAFLTLVSMRSFSAACAKSLQLYHGWRGRVFRVARGFDDDRRPPAEGAFLGSNDGRLVFARPDGRVTELVPAAWRDDQKAALRPWGDNGRLFAGRDGRLWLLREVEDHSWEVWTGTVDAPLERVDRLPPQPIVEGVLDGPDGLELLAYHGAAVHARYTPGRPPLWKPLPHGVEPYQGWRHRPGDELVDGTRAFWRMEAGQLIVDIKDAAGRLKLPFQADWKEPVAPQVVRFDGTMVWIVATDSLRRVRFDTGKIEASYPLPRARRTRSGWLKTFEATRSGLIVRADSGIWFVGWDGARRRLKL